MSWVEARHVVRHKTRAGAHRITVILWVFIGVFGGAGCRQVGESVGVRPRSLRDVPAERLAFRFEPDLNSDVLPASFKDEPETEELLAPIKVDFETRRAEERLVRTVLSPDSQRALALYETSETPEGDFRLDLYSSDGMFIRNVMPLDMSGAFVPSVAWSPDGRQIAFIAVKNSAATTQPTPLDPLTPTGGAGILPPGTTGDPAAPPLTMPTVAPLIAPVPTFSTEQIYVGDRDGLGLRPLTTREGLIYFQFAWAPDAHAIAALACKESEWNARRVESKAPAGRPRLIKLDGRERLLSDQLAETAPAWSPDASKVAAGFETDIAIFDALGDTPTAANIPLREPLLTASIVYDAGLPQEQQKTSAEGAAGAKGGDNRSRDSSNSGGGKKSVPLSAAQSPTPQQNTVASLSFNPVVRLEWVQPETLLVQTAFLRIYKDEPVKNYSRWHVLHFSPQAAVLSHRRENFPASLAPRVSRRWGINLFNPHIT